MICIFCLRDVPHEQLTDEHIFPESIGGKLVLTKEVCSSCANHLGHTIDAGLCNHTFIKFARMIHKVSGKTGYIPNPLNRGTLTDNQDIKVELTPDPGTGVLRHLVITQKIDQDTLIVDEKNKDNIPEIIDIIRKRKGLQPLSNEELQKLLAQLNVTEGKEIAHKLTVDLESFRRPILKIAYELAYHWLGTEYLQDPVAKILRDCVMDKKFNNEWSKYKIRGEINLVQTCNAGFDFWNTKHDQNSHVAVLLQSKSYVCCKIRIFNIFFGNICISENLAAYNNFRPRFLIINPETKTERESSLSKEVQRLSDALKSQDLPNPDEPI